MPQRFADVPPTHMFYAQFGITTGCATAPLRYCPDDAATRAQLAALLERGYPFPFPTEPCPRWGPFTLWTRARCRSTGAD